MPAGFHVERIFPGPTAVRTDGFALVLLERGELRARCEPGGLASLAAGDLLALAPGATGAFFSRRAAADAIVFRAPGEWLARALALAGLEPGPAPARSAVLRAGTEAASRAAQRLRRLLGRAGGQAPEGLLSRAADALELLAIAASAGRAQEAGPSRRRRSPRRDALAEALEKLGREPLHGLALSSFAGRLGLSERQASRLVRERLGISFGAHLTELRLSRARRLLAESDLPVIDVSEEAGFGSLGHFNHVFRVHTGETPSRFRARAQTPEPVGAALAPLERIAERARLASAHSSCFTSESSQAERGRLPS
ncbi:MAG TPA: AraC family transcriptional regulator [Myxococcota bacterium]|jgi:AraC-like DNA-binding protein